jgi:hypothetical protein
MEDDWDMLGGWEEIYEAFGCSLGYDAEEASR